MTAERSAYKITFGTRRTNGEPRFEGYIVIASASEEGAIDYARGWISKTPEIFGVERMGPASDWPED